MKGTQGWYVGCWVMLTVAFPMGGHVEKRLAEPSAVEGEVIHRWRGNNFSL